MSLKGGIHVHNDADASAVTTGKRLCATQLTNAAEEKSTLRAVPAKSTRTFGISAFNIWSLRASVMNSCARLPLAVAQ